MRVLTFHPHFLTTNQWSTPSVAAGSVLSIIYGWPPLDSSMDPIVDDINGWVHKLAKEAMPGARLVELFPWMVYIPAALAPWKKWALGQEAEDGKMFQRYLAEMQESKEVGSVGLAVLLS